MQAGRFRPEHGNDDNDERAREGLNRGVAAQLAQRIARGGHARFLHKPSGEAKPIDGRDCYHAQEQGDLRQQQTAVIGSDQSRNAAREIPGIDGARYQ